MSEEPLTTIVEEEAPHNSLSLKAVLLITVLISLLLVVFSFWLYMKDPNYKYDLARPDVKKKVEIDQEDQLIDEHSAVDEATVQQTKALVEESLKSLEGLDSFEPGPLSEGALSVN